MTSKMITALTRAAEAGKTDELRDLIALGGYDETAFLSPIQGAIQKGQVECVKLLIPAIGSRLPDSFALQIAAGERQHECLQVLIPLFDPKNPSSFKCDNSMAFWMAAQNGDTQSLQLLLAICDPKANDSCALRRAAVEGHHECLEMLIPLSDPQANDSGALYSAVWHGHDACVRLLCAVSDCEQVLWKMQHNHPDKEYIWKGLAQYVHTKQRERLTEAVDRAGAPRVSHKKI